MANKIYIIQDTTTDGLGYASNIKTRDIRLQGQNVESILINYYKQLKEVNTKISTIDIETIEGDIYQTISSTIGDMQDEISVIKQSADKIDLLVKSVDGSSSITVTDALINAVSSNIRLDADNIDLCGYVSNRTVTNENGEVVTIPGNWYIDEDGNSYYQNLAIEDEVSCNTISVNDISNPQYPKALTGSIDIYIDSINGSDDSRVEDESTFATLSGLMKALPKNLNGATIRIYLKTNDVGNFSITYFYGGRLLIFLNQLRINGYIRAYCTYADIKIYGGNSETSTSYGTISPSLLYSSNADGTDCASILLHEAPFVAIYYCNVYGSKSNVGSFGIRAIEYSNVRIDNVNFYDCYNCGTASDLSNIFAINTSGTASNIGWLSYTGSQIFLRKGSQAGGTKANYYEGGGNVIQDTTRNTIKLTSNGTGSDITHDGNGGSDTNPSNPGNNNNSTTKTTKTVTYTSTNADTYRSTVYNNWKKDGTARQGDYGYGDCNGCWFFGNQFATLKGKTINSITITLKRQTGGYYSANKAVIKMHNHSSRPSGAPSYLTWSKTVSLAVGDTKSVTITDSAVLTAIKNGTMKGFGVQSAYNKSSYAVYSGTLKVKVTYVE